MTINVNFKTKEITYDNEKCISHINAIFLSKYWFCDWKLKFVE